MSAIPSGRRTFRGSRGSGSSLVVRGGDARRRNAELCGVARQRDSGVGRPTGGEYQHGLDRLGGADGKLRDRKFAQRPGAGHDRSSNGRIGRGKHAGVACVTRPDHDEGQPTDTDARVRRRRISDPAAAAAAEADRQRRNRHPRNTVTRSEQLHQFSRATLGSDRRRVPSVADLLRRRSGMQAIEKSRAKAIAAPRRPGRNGDARPLRRAARRVCHGGGDARRRRGADADARPALAGGSWLRRLRSEAAGGPHRGRAALAREGQRGGAGRDARRRWGLAQRAALE